MNRWFLALALAAVLVVAGTLVYVLFQPEFLREEHVGGKYDCRIGFTGEDPRGFEVGRIFYTKDGTAHDGYFNEYLRNALDWIKANTSDDAVILSWWDYGHMITGYGERETVVKNPSEEALISVRDPGGFQELEPHERIADTAGALTTTNENDTLAIMSKYGATHILVTSEDGKGKPQWIFYFAGLNFTDFLNTTWQDTSMAFVPNQYNELGKETSIYRVLTGADFPRMTLVYSDENVTIYSRST